MLLFAKSDRSFSKACATGVRARTVETFRVCPEDAGENVSKRAARSQIFRAVTRARCRRAFPPEDRGPTRICTVANRQRALTHAAAAQQARRDAADAGTTRSWPRRPSTKPP